MPIWACVGVQRAPRARQFALEREVFFRGVRDGVGCALYAAQTREMSGRTKPLHGLSAG